MIDKLGFDYDKINEADDHNATPLYHAALIGNTEICCFLLQRGAICTENDSARVFYVALTPSLRSILREWSLSAASVDPYLQSWQQNFTAMNQNSLTSDGTHSISDSNAETEGNSEQADCMIHIWNTNENGEQHPKTKFRSLAVHRIMLKARCPYLFDRLEEKLDGVTVKWHVVHLNGCDRTSCDVLSRFIEYLYTGKIEVMTLEMAFYTLQFAKEWNVHAELCAQIQSKIDDFLLLLGQHKQKIDLDHRHGTHIVINNTKKSSWCRTTNPVVLASLGVGDNNIMAESESNIDELNVEFIKCTITDTDRLRSDMKQLAQLVAAPSLDEPLNQWTNFANDTCSDLTIRCHSVKYYVHQFRLIQHSEYFLCALKGNFLEATTSTIDLSSMIPINAEEVLSLIIQWMYADCFLSPGDVTISAAMELLHVCSALLCSPRLFSYVLNTIITPNLSVETVFDMLHFSRAYPGSVDRLESKCCEVIAKNLEEILSNNETAEEIRYMITVEFSATRQGGDIRTSDIPLVAEIRRAINRLVNITMVQRLQKLDLLKAFVEDVSRELQRDQCL